MKRVLFLIMPMLLFVFAFQPTHLFTVKGSVTDESGQPLSSVAIQYKGVSQKAFTNSKGYYQITVPTKNGQLIFSALGYATTVVNIKGKSEINVSLKKSTVTVQQEVILSGKAAKYRTMSNADKMQSPMMLSRMPNSYTTQDDGGYYSSSGNDERVIDFNREGYDKITENPFKKVNDYPLSTFSIDVDAASYSNVRRFLNQGQLPPAGAVRIEEMINYFKYDYKQPKNGQPFSIHTEMANAPWNPNNKLVLIGLQGKKIPTDNLPASNLVFLIDVSGSMRSSNKLPLVKASLKMLVEQLREQDKISLVVYAGAAGLVLPPTSGAEKTKIKDAIDKLRAGGSTAGGAGIKLAYKTAEENFMKNGNNRVILCTDGDFNVGESSDDAMERLIEEKRKTGVFLTVLGYGMGNYQDAKMQKLADKGNGNHAYIDGISEAKKVLVNEFGGTLFTIAKDVKLQIEFNPAKVQGYRLIGYENRMLANEDFNDDKKDAGELGSGHTVTAIYEVIPVGVKSDFLKDVDPLKYRNEITKLSPTAHNGEILTVKFRYKEPDGEVSKLIVHPVKDENIALANTSDNFRFASAVAEFGMLLRHSIFRSNATYANVLEMARNARGKDDEGYRSEFIRLVESTQMLAKAQPERDVMPLSQPIRKMESSGK